MNQKRSRLRLPLLTTVFATCLSLTAPIPAIAQEGGVFVRNQDYFRDVIALSEVLGKAHAVRVVCNGRNDQYWRSYMQRLLDLEAAYGGGLRTSMANGFNAGFSTTEAQFPTCSQAAVEAEKGYAADGQRYANRLAAANIPGVR